jgi:hypothetical protein
MPLRLSSDLKKTPQCLERCSPKKYLLLSTLHPLPSDTPFLIIAALISCTPFCMLTAGTQLLLNIRDRPKSDLNTTKKE